MALSGTAGRRFAARLPAPCALLLHLTTLALARGSGLHFPSTGSSCTLLGQDGAEFSGPQGVLVPIPCIGPQLPPRHHHAGVDGRRDPGNKDAEGGKCFECVPRSEVDEKALGVPDGSLIGDNSRGSRNGQHLGGGHGRSRGSELAVTDGNDADATEQSSEGEGRGATGEALAAGIAAALVAASLSAVASSAVDSDDAATAALGVHVGDSGWHAPVVAEEVDDGRLDEYYYRGRGGVNVNVNTGPRDVSSSPSLRGGKGGHARGDTRRGSVREATEGSVAAQHAGSHGNENGGGGEVTARVDDGRNTSRSQETGKGSRGGVFVKSEFFPMRTIEEDVLAAERELQVTTSSPTASPVTPSPTEVGTTLPPGTTPAPTEPTGTKSPDATPSPVPPTPVPTAMPTNSTTVDEVLDTTGEAASSAVAVAVASTAAAVTVTAMSTTTATTAATATATTVATATVTTAASTSAASSGAAAGGTAIAATGGGVTTATGVGGAASGAGTTVGGGVAAGGGAASGGTTAGVTAGGATATGGTTSGVTAGGTAASGGTTTGVTVGGTTAVEATAAESAAAATTSTTTAAATTTTTGTGTATTTAAGGTTTGTTTSAGGIPDTTGIRQATNTQGNTTTGNMTSNSGGATQEAAAQPQVSDPGTVSSRSPSATLGLLMMFQMQFLSLLRLLEANISAPFRALLDQLKWLNLHFEVDFGFLSCDDEDENSRWTENDNGTWLFNTFVVFGFLVVLIVFHILLLSYMEASWLSQANAIHRNRLARLRERSQQQETGSPLTSKSYGKWLDANNADRDLDDQEARATERFLRRHNSVWMYFPHIELVFLLFAYQGASAAEARMLLSGCTPLVILGACALFVFPILMILYVGRIVWNRIKPQSGPITFEASAPEGSAQRPCWCIALCRGFCDGWRNGHSVFEWADKGSWRCRTSEEEDFDGRKFRIGFEPLFVDFTKEGAVYIIFLLFKWFALGIVAGLVTNGTVQTAALFAIYVVDIILLCVLRPFSNSFIQWVETVLVTADAATLLLMVYASVLDPKVSDDHDRIDIIYAICLLLQTLAIIFITIPIYIDTFVVIVSQIRNKAGKLLRGERAEKQDKEPSEIKGTCAETCSIFCVLVRENFIGCVKESVYGPRANVPTSFQNINRLGSRRLSNLSSIPEEKHDAEHGLFRSGYTVKSSSHPVRRHIRSSSADKEGGASLDIAFATDGATADERGSADPRSGNNGGRFRGRGDDYDSEVAAPSSISSREGAAAAGAGTASWRGRSRSPMSQRPSCYDDDGSGFGVPDGGGDARRERTAAASGDSVGVSAARMTRPMLLEEISDAQTSSDISPVAKDSAKERNTNPQVRGGTAARDYPSYDLPMSTPAGESEGDSGNYGYRGYPGIAGGGEEHHARDQSPASKPTYRAYEDSASGSAPRSTKSSGNRDEPARSRFRPMSSTEQLHNTESEFTADLWGKQRVSVGASAGRIAEPYSLSASSSSEEYPRTTPSSGKGGSKVNSYSFSASGSSAESYAYSGGVKNIRSNRYDSSSGNRSSSSQSRSNTNRRSGSSEDIQNTPQLLRQQQVRQQQQRERQQQQQQRLHQQRDTEHGTASQGRAGSNSRSYDPNAAAAAPAPYSGSSVRFAGRGSRHVSEDRFAPSPASAGRRAVGTAPAVGEWSTARHRRTPSGGDDAGYSGAAGSGGNDGPIQGRDLRRVRRTGSSEAEEAAGSAAGPTAGYRQNRPTRQAELSREFSTRDFKRR